MTAALTLALALRATPAAAAEPVASRRFVLAVAAPHGGAGRQPLRYPARDAAALVDVLVELGGVERRDVTVLVDPSAADIARALDDLDAALRASAAAREEVVFYYSGHADADGLLPAEGALPWIELRRAVEDLPADVKLGLVDACASGSLVRSKGGAHVPGFLGDTADVVTGEVWMASSAADEVSQESDRLQGSYFTHHVVAGLRGAADADHDGRVTLPEVYDYAYSQTLRATEAALGGAQHASYAFTLVGQGELLLTDLRQRSARLAFDRALDGRVTVRDDGGHLVVELDKPVGREVEVALPPGLYDVRLRGADRVFTGVVQVTDDQSLLVDAATLTAEQHLERTRARGGDTAAAPVVAGGVSLAPGLATWGLGGGRAVHGASLNLLGGLVADRGGLDLGVLDVARGDVAGAQLEGLAAWSQGRLRGMQLGAVTGAAAGVHGAQWGLAAWSGRDVRGLQLGGVTWAEGAVRGAQLGALNVARGRSAQGMSGAQIGVANVARTAVRGAQLGAFNQARRLVGLQLGVVNVTRSADGLQVGLINVSEDPRTETLGVINVVRDGYRALELGGDEVAPVHVTLKTGGRHLYGVIYLGVDPATARAPLSLGGGVGAHVEARPVFFDVDLLVTLPEGPAATLFTDLDPSVVVRLRPQLGLPLHPSLALVVGPSLGISATTNGDLPREVSFTPSAVWRDGRGRTWAGFSAGLSLRL